MKIATWNCMGKLQNPFEFYNSFFESSFLQYANECVMKKIKVSLNQSKHLSELDEYYIRPYSFYGSEFRSYFTDIFDTQFTELQFLKKWNELNAIVPDRDIWKIDESLKKVTLSEFDKQLFLIIRQSMYVGGYTYEAIIKKHEDYLKLFTTHNSVKHKYNKILSMDADIFCIQECSQELVSQFEGDKTYKIIYHPGYMLAILYKPFCKFIKRCNISASVKMIGAVFQNVIVYCAHAKSMSGLEICSHFKNEIRLGNTINTPFLLCVDSNVKTKEISALNEIMAQVHLYNTNTSSIYTPTVIKMRSYLQCQLHKAWKNDTTCKDFIFYSKNNASYPSVFPYDNSFLPNADHLSDHKIVCVNIDLIECN